MSQITPVLYLKSKVVINYLPCKLRNNAISGHSWNYSWNHIIITEYWPVYFMKNHSNCKIKIFSTIKITFGKASSLTLNIFEIFSDPYHIRILFFSDVQYLVITNDTPICTFILSLEFSESFLLFVLGVCRKRKHNSEITQWKYTKCSAV
jgi:hypothetical protein